MKDYFTSISLPDAPGAEPLPSPEPAPLPDGTGNSTNIAVGGVEVVAVEKIADLVQTTMKCATAYKCVSFRKKQSAKPFLRICKKHLPRFMRRRNYIMICLSQTSRSMKTASTNLPR